MRFIQTWTCVDFFSTRQELEFTDFEWRESIINHSMIYACALSDADYDAKIRLFICYILTGDYRNLWKKSCNFLFMISVGKYHRHDSTIF